MGGRASESEEFHGFIVDHVRVAGAFVAYRSGVGGQAIVQSPRSTCSVPGGNVVTGLSVGPDDGILFPTADGGLVWLMGSGDMAQLRATGGPYGDPGPPPPLAPETRGRVLDTGAIDPASVQVTGNTVTWVNAGGDLHTRRVRRSAPRRIAVNPMASSLSGPVRATSRGPHRLGRSVRTGGSRSGPRQGLE
jgi:hypothetical protein